MNRLRLLREELEMSQAEIGKVLGITSQGVGLYENEKRDIPTDVLIKLSKFFGVSTDYILGKSNNRYLDKKINIDVADTPTKIPVVGKISAGLPILATENIESYEYAPSIYIKEGFEYFYLRVNGDSMNLKFNDGDLLLVQKQDNLENDEIGVILVDGMDATVKKYKYENGLVILSPMSTNTDHIVQIYNPKDINIKIIGKVVSYQGKV